MSDDQLKKALEQWHAGELGDEYVPSDEDLERARQVLGGPDDLDKMLAEQSQDPKFRGALEDAETRGWLLQTLLGYREEHKLEPRQVANRMGPGTSWLQVTKLESGELDPTLSLLQRYARAVGCELHLDVVPIIEFATLSGEPMSRSELRRRLAEEVDEVEAGEDRDA